MVLNTCRILKKKMHSFKCHVRLGGGIFVYLKTTVRGAGEEFLEQKLNCVFRHRKFCNSVKSNISIKNEYLL